MARGWKVVEYIAKPAVMVCLIAWLGMNGGWSGPLLWFTAGLVFSLAGDIFLMLPKERFIAGLISFLLAHIAYIIGLNTTPIPMNGCHPDRPDPRWVGLHDVVFAHRAGAGGDGRPQAQDTRAGIHDCDQPDAILCPADLRPPVMVTRGALLVGLGAVLFYLSDSLLAWNKFVSPLKYGELLVMITYHIGQVMITVGAALNFLP